MNPRKLRKNINQLMQKRLQRLPKMIIKGAWGTRPLPDRKTKHGLMVPMLEVVAVESMLAQLTMPVDVFEKAMLQAGFKRKEEVAGEPEKTI